MRRKLNELPSRAVDSIDPKSVEITQADIDAAKAIRDAGKLEPDERPSERLFSIALSRQLGRKVKVTFSEDSTETFIEYLDGH